MAIFLMRCERTVTTREYGVARIEAEDESAANRIWDSMDATDQEFAVEVDTEETLDCDDWSVVDSTKEA